MWRPVAKQVTRALSSAQASPSSPPSLSPSSPVTRLAELLRLQPAELETLDIARVNLLCAEGLPGAERLDIVQCLATLDRWADAVRRYTHDHLNAFDANPAEFDGHTGLFCFLHMASLLKHPNGIGVRYQPTAIGNYTFSDSRDDLLHGLLTRRLGTCTSLPVLCVAIGRRLCYPMHLAIAKGHVLCQWVDDRGKLNLEISCGRGGDTAPDEHYHHWPRPLTRADLASGRYLRPLTRREELALFLETRGHCLTDNRRFAEAREAYRQAHAAAPGWSDAENHLYSLSLHEQGHGTTPPFAVAPSKSRWTPLRPTIMSLPGLTH